MLTAILLVTCTSLMCALIVAAPVVVVAKACDAFFNLVAGV